MVCEVRVNKKSSYPCSTVLTAKTGYTVTYIWDSPTRGKVVSWWNSCKAHKPDARKRVERRKHTVVTPLIA